MDTPREAEQHGGMGWELTAGDPGLECQSCHL